MEPELTKDSQDELQLSGHASSIDVSIMVRRLRSGLTINAIQDEALPNELGTPIHLCPPWFRRGALLYVFSIAEHYLLLLTDV